MYTSSDKTMVKLVPLVQDIDAWKHHFKEMAKGNRYKQYAIQGSGTQRDPVIKTVTPTDAAFERAKALIKNTKPRKTPMRNKVNKKSKISRVKKSTHPSRTKTNKKVMKKTRNQVKKIKQEKEKSESSETKESVSVLENYKRRCIIGF